MTRIQPQTRQTARRLRHEMTRQERRLWSRLRELNRMLGTHFRRQAPLGPYIADFADLARRLVIEVDGGGHGGPGDARRDAWIAAQGFRVLRFWNPEVDGNLEGVMQAVLDVLESCAPPPSPPHQGEGRRYDLRGAVDGQGSRTE
jgi:very-short-patch-repair endonuclease